jgi:hypothetical protein
MIQTWKKQFKINFYDYEYNARSTPRFHSSGPVSIPAKPMPNHGSAG